MTDTIILVHGLWMTGLEMGLLKRRLEQDHGFACVVFSYASVTGAMQEHVARLHDLARQQSAPRLHFVGHSLGGVVIYNLLQATSELPPGRAVLLGSPLQGSRAAQVISQWALGRVAVGETVCHELGATQLREWHGEREIGIIAGSARLGLGQMLAPQLLADSDGTVLIEETRLPGATEHLVLPVGHTSMLFAPVVARQVAAFLRDGHFAHSDVRNDSSDGASSESSIESSIESSVDSSAE